jgi:hypothetical protein
MEILGNKKRAKNLNDNFYCDICDYKCNKIYNWNRHINTPKHIRKSKRAKTSQNEPSEYNEILYTCTLCNKSYKTNSGLWKHSKLCSIHKKELLNNSNVNDNNNEMDIHELVKYLMKENSDLKTIMAEQHTNMIEHNSEILKAIQNGTYITNNNNNNTINNNSHNKTFNLQVFLNETCKDAMNINDFVDSIKLQLSDFERMGEVGYAQGISDIITSNLQALDITQRPVHCTDKKRETMYVKDQDQWMKEDDNKSKIKKMIKRIENKNIQIIPQFQKKYPNYANPKSHESDKYHKTIIEVMGGAGGSEGKEGKIIRNISKVTTVREKE